MEFYDILWTSRILIINFSKFPEIFISFFLSENYILLCLNDSTKYEENCKDGVICN